MVHALGPPHVHPSGADASAPLQAWRLPFANAFSMPSPPQAAAHANSSATRRKCKDRRYMSAMRQGSNTEDRIAHSDGADEFVELRGEVRIHRVASERGLLLRGAKFL